MGGIAAPGANGGIEPGKRENGEAGADEFMK
jgi:hypothetical protein